MTTTNKKHIWFSSRGFANEGEFMSYTENDKVFVDDLITAEDGNPDSVLNLDVKVRRGYIRTIREYYNEYFDCIPEEFWPDWYKAEVLTVSR